MITKAIPIVTFLLLTFLGCLCQPYSFSPNGREVSIKDNRLPEPWLNRLTNDQFHAWITTQGYFEIFLLNPELNGLTNPQDVSGNIYLRDAASGKFARLNTKGENVSSWAATVGLGYNRIDAEALDASVSITYFIPRDDNAFIILVKLRNESSTPRTYDLFSQVEFNLGDHVKSIVYKNDGRGGSQFNLYKKVEFKDGFLKATQPVWRSLGPTGKPWPYIGFMGSSMLPVAHDTHREDFLGPELDPARPKAVREGKCSNKDFWSYNDFPWGVIQQSIKLGPGEERELSIVLGMARDEASVKGLNTKYSDLGIVHSALSKLNRFHNNFLDNAVKVTTPEKEIDRVINIWSPYQWRSTVSRDLNTGKPGLAFWNYSIEDGNFGFWGGDTELAVQPHDLAITKESIRRNMMMQYASRDTKQLSALAPSMLYGDLDYRLPTKAPEHGFAVSHHHEVYGLYSISLYLRETGDFAFLKEEIPFVTGEKGTVYDHIVHGVNYAINGLSSRGLPLVNRGVGDWNDEINRMSREGKAESVMYAMQLCYLLKEFATMAQISGHKAQADEWLVKYELIRNACNTYGWDGDWYIYAFADGDSEMYPIGTRKHTEGSIYLNSQSWAIIGQVADAERSDKLLAAVRARLLSNIGPLLFMPSYTKTDLHVGVQSQYAPGWRNACMYPRPAGWAVMAACLANDPDLAWAMYKPASLPYISKNIQRYRAEPYVYAENYVGPDHPSAGMGQFKWNLGEGANWMWHSYVYYILGIRPDFTGLVVDPKIPSHWDNFTVERNFRGSHYVIDVINPSHVSVGVQSIRVDGKKIKGNIIIPHVDGKIHHVKVVMGK